MGGRTGIRTTNPWGHVSKASLIARQNEERKLVACFAITKLENGEALFTELKAIQEKAVKEGIPALSEEEKKRYNEICDTFVAQGIREEQIEIALG